MSASVGLLIELIDYPIDFDGEDFTLPDSKIVPVYIDRFVVTDRYSKDILLESLISNLDAE